jgi:hypothetical protein
LPLQQRLLRDCWIGELLGQPYQGGTGARGVLTRPAERARRVHLGAQPGEVGGDPAEPAVGDDARVLREVGGGGGEEPSGLVEPAAIDVLDVADEQSACLLRGVASLLSAGLMQRRTTSDGSVAEWKCA